MAVGIVKLAAYSFSLAWIRKARHVLETALVAYDSCMVQFEEPEETRKPIFFEGA
jgi:hypothetical protein